MMNRPAACRIVALIVSLSLATSAAYALAPVHRAPDGVQQAINVELAGQYGGGLRPIAAEGDRVCAGVGRRLVILDVADAAHPAVLGETSPFPGLVIGVAISGSLAYVTDSETGLHVVDFSDPVQPVELGLYAPSAGRVHRVAVGGNHAYVAWYYLSPEDGLQTGVHIVDVSDPAQPALAAIYGASEYIMDVVVSGAHAYVADSEGLHILDVSDPAQPVEVGSYAVSPWVTALTVAGSRVYVTVDQVLRILDVSDAAHPTMLSVYGTAGQARDVQVAGDYAYVACWAAGLQIVDVSDPLEPAWAAAYDAPGASQVALASDYAYVDDGGVLRIVDVSDPLHPAAVGTYEPPGSFFHVAALPGYAYVTGGGRLHIVDVSDPAQPARVGVYDPGVGALYGVAVADHHVYIAYGYYDTQAHAGLYVLDVSDPASPAMAGSCEIAGPADEVVLAGDYAYLYSPYGSRMYIVDVSDPAHPFAAGDYTAADGEVSDVAVVGTYAYVAYYHEEPMVVPPVGGVRIVDVADPAQPADAGSFATWDVLVHLDTAGDYVYVLGYELHIFDVSDPLHPTEVGADAGGHYGYYDLTVVGDYAYIAGLEAMGIVRVADPAHPARAGGYDKLWMADEVAVLDDHAYVADGEGGLAILHLAPFPFHHYLPYVD